MPSRGSKERIRDLLDYEGFIKGVSYDSETELKMAQAGLSAHVLEED